MELFGVSIFGLFDVFYKSSKICIRLYNTVTFWNCMTIIIILLYNFVYLMSNKHFPTRWFLLFIFSKLCMFLIQFNVLERLYSTYLINKWPKVMLFRIYTIITYLLSFKISLYLWQEHIVTIIQLCWRIVTVNQCK